MTMFNKVLEFHEAFNHPVGVPASLPLLALRFNLIDEEVKEVAEELANLSQANSDSNIASTKMRLSKELCDLMYVVLGTGVALGLPLDDVFNEVHLSNMSKLDSDGKAILREDGKILKSENYKEPNLEQYF